MKAPKKPMAPKVPGQPKAPGAKKGKYESKTGNAECSGAMSLWQKAIRSGNSPGQQVYAKLAQCRASVRTNKQNAGKVAAGSMKQQAATAVVNRSDSRITDNLATIKARKERLKSLVQDRSNRQISTADRQKAMDVAAKVTGNQTSPSAGLKRLQKVAKPRATKAAPAASSPVPGGGVLNSPPPAVLAQIHTNHTPKARSRSLTPKQPIVPLNPPGFNRFAGPRAEAAALLRNMRATGRGQGAYGLSGMAKGQLWSQIGAKPKDVRNYTGSTILDIASRQKNAGIQPVPKAAPIRAARSPDIVAKRSAIAAKMKAEYQSQKADVAGASHQLAGPAYRHTPNPNVPKVGYRAEVKAGESATLNQAGRNFGRSQNLPEKDQLAIRMDAARSAGARMAMRSAIAAQNAPKAPDKAAALVARVRTSGNHAGNRHDAGVNKHWTQAALSARTGPQMPAGVLKARQDAANRASTAADLVAKVRASSNHPQNVRKAAMNHGLATVKRTFQGPELPARVSAPRQLVAKVRGSLRHQANRQKAQWNKTDVTSKRTYQTGPKIPKMVLAGRKAAMTVAAKKAAAAGASPAPSRKTAATAVSTMGADKAAALVARVRALPTHSVNQMRAGMSKNRIRFKNQHQGPQIPKDILTTRRRQAGAQKAAATRAGNASAAARGQAQAAGLSPATAGVVAAFAAKTSPKGPTNPVKIVPGSRGTPSHLGKDGFKGDIMDMIGMQGRAFTLKQNGVAPDVAMASAQRMYERAKQENMSMQNRWDRLRDTMAQRAGSKYKEDSNINPVLSSGVSMVQWHSSDSSKLTSLDPTKTVRHRIGRGSYSDQNLKHNARYGPNHYIFKPPTGSVLQQDLIPRTVQSRRAIEAIAKATGNSRGDVHKTLVNMGGTGDHMGGHNLANGGSAKNPTDGTANIIRLAGAAQANPTATKQLISRHSGGHLPGGADNQYRVKPDQILGKAGFAGITINTSPTGKINVRSGQMTSNSYDSSGKLLPPKDPTNRKYGGMNNDHGDDVGGAHSRRTNYSAWFKPVDVTRVTKASLSAGKHDKMFTTGGLKKRIPQSNKSTISGRDSLLLGMRS